VSKLIVLRQRSQPPHDRPAPRDLPAGGSEIADLVAGRLGQGGRLLVEALGELRDVAGLLLDRAPLGLSNIFPARRFVRVRAPLWRVFRAPRPLHHLLPVYRQLTLMQSWYKSPSKKLGFTRNGLAVSSGGA
jgi:hypothetical protein